MGSIEARETGRRSTGVLSSGTTASSQANKEAVVMEDRANRAARSENCKYSGRTEHGNFPSVDVREKSCPAWDRECSKCSKKRHFQKVCQDKTKEDKVRVKRSKKTATPWYSRR